MGTVPYRRRQELRRELASHLESLIEALEELGDSREEAVRDALQRFGDPVKLGAQWASQWSKTADPSAWGLLPPLWATLVFYFGLTLITSLLVTTDRTVSRTDEMILILFATVVPALAGLLIGSCARGRGALGSFFGMFPLSLFTGLLFQLAARMDPPGSNGPAELIGGLVVLQVVFWLPINTTFAALGSWLRRRVKFTRPHLALK